MTPEDVICCFKIINIDNIVFFDIIMIFYSWEVSNMLIQVKYPDNRYDFVKELILDLFIESNKVVEFKRATGWVRIGVDPIRKSRRDRTTIQAQQQ